MSKTKKSKNNASPKEFAWCMYIGPTIRGFLRRGQMFTESADAVRERLAASKYPDCANLIADGKALPEARRQVRTPGTALYTCYQSLSKK